MLECMWCVIWCEARPPQHRVSIEDLTSVHCYLAGIATQVSSLTDGHLPETWCTFPGRTCLPNALSPVFGDPLDFPPGNHQSVEFGHPT
jgi:hypothetical protein